MYVFDFEVVKYDWLVVFKNLRTGEYIDIINDRARLERFYQKNKHELFVGFNNKNYDNLILAGILNGENPFSISQEIIKSEDAIRVYRIFNVTGYPLKGLDLAQDNLQLSLKQIEGYMSTSIKESDISFDIDRKLTHEEIVDMVEYCHKDVDATELLLEKRGSYVKSKIKLVELFKLPVKSLIKTNAQLCAEILKAVPHSYGDEFIYNPPNELEINKYSEAYKFYNGELDYDDTLDIDIGGIEHRLAYGGLHGAIKNYHHKGTIWQIDATSYYPSLMIQYNYLSRNVFDTSRYDTIYNQRVDAKIQGDYLKSEALKLVLNTTYGSMKNKYNGLYDPHMANQICITGQLLLIDLIEKIEPYCTLIQTNTDGILVIPHNKSKIEEQILLWEERTRISLETTVCKEVWQKDVNNYVMVFENGEIKTKGAYVSQYEGGLKNSMRVVDLAVVNYFLYGKSPIDTIYESDNIFDFQIIKKSGGTYCGTEWNNYIGGEWCDSKYIEVNKVNRIYASKNLNHGTVYKLKDKGNEQLSRDRIAGLPTHCIVDNDNTVNLEAIDRNWYIEEAHKRICDFKGV